MRRSRWLRLPLLLLVTTACAHPALAGTSPPGVNLRWDRCFADNGVWNRDFACDSNDGQDQLVGSFELAQPLTGVVTEDITLDIRAASGTLPAWWSVFNLGACRRPAFDLLAYPSSDPSTCEPWVVFPSGGGIAAYAIGEQGPDHVRVRASVTSQGSQVTLSPGREYFGFRFTLDHSKTVGPGACGGCNVPVCIFLSRISLYQFRSTSAAIYLDHGANYLGSQYVTWQSGYPTNVHQACDPSFPPCTLHYESFGCALATPTQTRRPTWGEVKALYR